MKRMALAATLSVAAFGAVTFAQVFSGKSNSGPGIEISISTGVGISIGQAKEFVYDQRVSTNYVVSELDWPFQSLPWYGLKVGISISNAAFLKLDLRSGLAAWNGLMTDSDFLNGDGVRTLFSESDCFTDQALDVDLRLGWKFEVMPSLSLSPYLSLGYKDFKWSARDGYLQYPPAGSNYYVSNGTLVYGTNPAWSSAVTETPIYGVGIIYEQRMFIPALGIEVRCKLSNSISATASFAATPIVSCWSLDDHTQRQISISDTFSGGFQLKPELGAEVRLSDRSKVGLRVTYETIFNLVGSSIWQYEGTSDSSPNSQYIAGPGSSSTVKNGGGAAFQSLDVSISYSLSL